ncbi:hypothetical protein H2198_002913 [Neophaeococcomyces mojaviensis]|uniref:Uncharacterized protein n=1 Tax=Neophaeococcomyces mojaviensis TaxID=3383035 RepID=A0ACC3ACW4_9EURO|nr:hypothetical protein H2198_002913 [Knufia sp. JES_112]
MASATSACPSNTDSKKLLWDDETFASRYRTAEGLTGDYALDLLKQMGVSATTPAPVKHLDLACGTGVVAKHAISLLEVANKPASSKDQYNFTAADLAPAMLDALRSRFESESWSIRPEVIKADMRDTNLPADNFTHITCSFGPCNAPNPLATLRESYRLLTSGGVAGWTAWTACGWYPDVMAALDDIRSHAAKASATGKGTEDDEKLAKVPQMQSFRTMIGRFTGIEDLSVAKDEDGEMPKWESDEYFVKQVRKAGFVDVQVNVVNKTLFLSGEDAYEIVKPILGILGNWWSQEERKVLEGGLLEKKVQEWFKKKVEENEGKKVVWDTWKAMIVTGRKE